MLYQIIDADHAVGADPVFFRHIAERWLDTGEFYTERQLAGPYTTVTLVDNLYPPSALYLFVPFTVLPPALWWALPIAFVIWTVWRLRPRSWAWPLLALVLALPKTWVVLFYGNTDMWLTAFVAGAVLWAWPAVLITIKPSLVFLAAIGITRRSWWVAAVVFALLNVPLIPLWLAMDFGDSQFNSHARVFARQPSAHHAARCRLARVEPAAWDSSCPRASPRACHRQRSPRPSSGDPAGLTGWCAQSPPPSSIPP